jgi:hypothetical protein
MVIRLTAVFYTGKADSLQPAGFRPIMRQPIALGGRKDEMWPMICKSLSIDTLAGVGERRESLGVTRINTRR